MQFFILMIKLVPKNALKNTEITLFSINKN